MRITVTLTPKAKSTLKTLPIASQSAIKDCLHRLEHSISLPDEKALNNTGYRCLLAYPTGELIIFTREESKAWLTQETIYRVNIIKITSNDYLEQFAIQEILQSGLISVPSPSAQLSTLSKITELTIKSMDQVKRFEILFKVFNKIVVFLGGLLIALLIG